MGSRIRSLTVLLVAVAMLSTAAPAAAGGNMMLQKDCSEPPAIMAVEDIEAGMTGKSYTTMEGREISEFDFEVLGVLPNGIYPLIDMIVIEVSGEAVEAVGGIAGGFSGSPAYIDGELIGAIAYGFFGNSFIGGITPAAEMANLIDIPFDSLNSNSAEAMAEAGGGLAALGTPSLLPVPVGVGGADAKIISSLQREADRRGIPYHFYQGAMSGGGPMGELGGEILPGGSMSAVLAEGDYLAFGTGTATYCDGDTILGWGHPFFWSGNVSMGMNTADVVTIIEDSTGFGNFKLATLGEAAGRIDFDGNAGIRGIAGEPAPTVPITSYAEFEELGVSRMGRTDAYLTNDPFFTLGNVVANHLISNLDYISRTGFRPGSSDLAWTITGLRQDGSEFDLSYNNQYWDGFSITNGSVFELFSFVDQILFNPHEEVSITAVDISRAELFSDRRTIDIQEVRVSTTTSPEPVADFGLLPAMPGDTVTIEVDMQPFGGTEFTEMIRLDIPADFPGGFGSLSVRGGSGEFFFEEPFFNGPTGGVDDFDGLLESLANRDHNYDLVAELTLFEGGGDEPPFEEPPVEEPPFEEPPFEEPVAFNGPVEPQMIKESIPFDGVVTGQAFFDLDIFGGEPGPGGPLFAELSGANVPGGGDPDGFGSAAFFVEGDQLFFDLLLENVDEPITAAHIHGGLAGEEGPVLVDLDWATNGPFGQVTVDPFLLEEMLAVPEFFYVQVHSEAHPNGAVRGQLSPDPSFPEEPEEPGEPEEPYEGVSNVGFVTAGGEWHLPGSDPFYFGTPGDVPFLGDWDGDGEATPGVYRPESGFAYFRNSNDTGVADGSFYMGIAGDQPLVGDWDGDGADSFGVYRNGVAYLRNSLTTGMAEVEFSFGADGDVAFTGDFDGDGSTNIGVHRPATGTVYLRLSHTSGPADVEFSWGLPGDQVMAGDWNGDGVDTVGLIRSSDGKFYLRDDNTAGPATLEWVLDSTAGFAVIR